MKLSGKIRSSVGKVDLWHSAVDNANLDVLFSLRQLMAISKTRISQNVVVFVVSLIQSFAGSKIEKNEMGGTCGVYGREERCAQVSGGET